MSKLFQSSRIIKVKSTESTNSYLSNLTNLPEGSVVIAYNQTHGRGQGKNKWESEPGMNLTFSIILYPNFLRADLQFYISKIIALAVSDLISLDTDRVAIKWPNDIYVHDKKVAGILIENAIEGNNLKQSIAGIGVNINQKNFLSDAPNPISLFQVTKKEYSIDELLHTLTDLIEYRYFQLKNNEYLTIDQNYQQILYRKNQKYTFVTEGKRFIGIITGVESTGEIIIEDLNGLKHKFWHKEVEFVL